MTAKKISVAIDGPSGAGKSTLAKKAAAELGYLYVDTGAIYRTVALSAVKQGIDPSDAQRLIPTLSDLDIRLEYSPEDGLQHMLLNGEDVTQAIREHAISAHASTVSAIPQVRSFLLELQRDFARKYNVIMDGRDIGTVVLPNADVKIYLTASAQARAQRRHLELASRGQSTDYEVVLQDMKARDEQDMNRAVAPLRQAEDAVLVDTTLLDPEQSLQAILSVIKENVG